MLLRRAFTARGRGKRPGLRQEWPQRVRRVRLRQSRGLSCTMRHQGGSRQISLVWAARGVVHRCSARGGPPRGASHMEHGRLVHASCVVKRPPRNTLTPDDLNLTCLMVFQGHYPRPPSHLDAGSHFVHTVRLRKAVLSALRCAADSAGAARDLHDHSAPAAAIHGPSHNGQQQQQQQRPE